MQQLLRHGKPDQVKVSHALRTRQAVVKLSRDRFGVELPLHTIGLNLSRWIYTAQKLMGRINKQSSR